MISEKHGSGSLLHVKSAFGVVIVGIVAGIRRRRRPTAASQVRKMIGVTRHEEEAVRDGFRHVSVEIDETDITCKFS